MIKHSTLFIVFLGMISSTVWADFKSEVAKDMGEVSATLVASVKDSWLIDVDAKQGVQVGDLFSLAGRHKDGQTDNLLTVLQVTKVKSGYSYVDVLNGRTELRPGVAIRRFSGLPATFWDYSGDGKPVYTHLTEVLPHLVWAPYAIAQKSRPENVDTQPKMPAGVVFVLTSQGLASRDHEGKPLRFYQAPIRIAAPAQPRKAVSSGNALVRTSKVLKGSSRPSEEKAEPGLVGRFLPSEQKIVARSSATEPVKKDSTPTGSVLPRSMKSRDGVWYGPRISGKPIGVDVKDFDGDGQREVALCFKDRLVIARVVEGHYETVANYDFAHSGSALSLEGFDLDKDGRPEIYVSMVTMDRVRSVAFELRGNRLVRVVGEFPHLLRKVAFHDEGPQLLSQELNPNLLDHQRSLDGPLFRVNRVGSKLQRAGVVVLPSRIQLHGFAPVMFQKKDYLVNITSNDNLEVLEPGGARLWTSYEYVGGSETFFDRSDGEYQGGYRHVYLKPRIEAGPDGMVLIPVNEGGRLFGSFRHFKSSHVRAMSFDGYSMREHWRTVPQNAYLADFRLADADNDGVDEVVMLVVFSHGEWPVARYGSSTLLIYEMQ